MFLTNRVNFEFYSISLLRSRIDSLKRITPQLTGCLKEPFSMTSISIIGSYPPNYGGISTHVRRLHLLLKQTQSCRIKDLYSTGGEEEVDGVDRIYGNKLRRVWQCRVQLNQRRSDIEHFHVSAMRKFLWSTPVLLTGHKAKRVLTIHGGAFPDVVAAFNMLEKKLFQWMLGRFEHFVCVSEKQRQVLDFWGVPTNKISVINAYLPPVESPPSDLFSNVEQAKASGRQILICAAQYLEHYGIAELTKALCHLEAELGEKAPQLALISYAGVNDLYRSKCLALRTELISVMEFVNLEPEQISELMALGDMFVRPTWWDGDAISVREAAFFGNRLIATDVTTRPEGTVLCRAKDSDSLHHALRECVLDPDKGVVSFDHKQSLNALAQIYKGLGVTI